MKTIAFRMKLLPGNEAEYQRRHEAIWPELSTLLKDSGIEKYTIFLHEATATLFAVQETSGIAGSQELGEHPLVQRWWDYMADIMETNEDNSPVTVPLKNVFTL